MIKELLDGLNLFILQLDPTDKVKKMVPDKLKNDFLDEITRDLARLEQLDPTFFDGSKGYIDYYSPFAEEQINNKQELLEKYINYLIGMQAVMVSIRMREKRLIDINANKKSKPNKVVNQESKAAEYIAALRTTTGFRDLAKRNDLQAVVTRIKEINDCRKKPQSEKSEEEKSKINRFNEDMDSLFGDQIEEYASLKQKTVRLQSMLNKHMKLKEKIPKGMIDVKRALSFQNALKDTQKRIEIQKEALSQLVDGDGNSQRILSQIECLETAAVQLSSIKFSTSDDIDLKTHIPHH